MYMVVCVDGCAYSLWCVWVRVLSAVCGRVLCLLWCIVVCCVGCAIVMSLVVAVVSMLVCVLSCVDDVRVVF